MKIISSMQVILAAGIILLINNLNFDTAHSKPVSLNIADKGNKRAFYAASPITGEMSAISTAGIFKETILAAGDIHLQITDIIPAGYDDCQYKEEIENYNKPKTNLPEKEYLQTTQNNINNDTDEINSEQQDRREFLRFSTANCNKPIILKAADKITGLLDISRGGIAVKHENSLKAAEVVPVHIIYEDIEIKTDIKVVSTTASRAGAQFVNLDTSTANQLLYLSIRLESDNNMLPTKLSN